jgi:hypothetical protein
MTPFRLSMATIATEILVVSLVSHARSVGAVAPTRNPGSVRLATPMLEPRSDQSATLLPDGTVLIAGGMRRNQDFYRSAEIFDPATNQFSRTGDMSIARVGHAAVLRTGLRKWCSKTSCLDE